MTRYADTSSVRGSGRGSPSTESPTVSLALRGLRDQLRQLREIGLRRQLVGLAARRRKAEQPVQLDDGLPAGLLDRAEHLLGLGGLRP